MGNKIYNGIVYMYTNKINGKKYIGQTTHESKRKTTHKNSKSKTPFSIAIRKYGFDGFEYSIISKCVSDNINDLTGLMSNIETYFISKLKSHVSENGYNVLREGESRRGFKHSQETKDKISVMQKGIKKNISEEGRVNILKAISGDNHYLRKNPELQSGSKNHQFGLKGKLNIKSKPVVRIDSLENIRYYDCASEALVDMFGEERDTKNIRQCCSGRTKSAYGYKWKFLSDIEI